MGANAPTFCQDGDQDFSRIDEKHNWREGSSKSSEKKRTWPNILFMPPWMNCLENGSIAFTASALESINRFIG